MEEKDQLLTQSVNGGGVCRTAPATPGLLKISVVPSQPAAALFWFDLEFGNNEAVCRTAPATPGLLKIYKRIRRLLPIATNNERMNELQTNEQHPKNRDIKISFFELFCSC